MPGPPSPTEGEPSPPATPQPDDGVTEQGQQPVGLDPPVSKAAILSALKGLWQFAPDLCEGAGAELEGNILLQFEDDGKFIGAAEKITMPVRNPLMPDLAVSVKLAVEGQLQLGGDSDQAGHVPASVTGIKILEDQYVVQGDGMGMDISALVSPLLHGILNKIANSGLLALGANDENQLLTFISGGNRQVFVRKLPAAQMEAILFRTSHPVIADTVPTLPLYGSIFDLPFGNAVPRTNIARHWAENLNLPISFTQGTHVTLDVWIKVTAGTVYRLFGIDKNNPAMNFASAERTATDGIESFSMTAKTPLPHRICYLNSSITWNLQLAGPAGGWVGVEQPEQAGVTVGRSFSSGGHRIYTTFGDPILPCTAKGENLPTERRLMQIVDAAKTIDLGKPATREELARELAAAIQLCVNEAKHSNGQKIVSTGSASTFARLKDPTPFTPDSLWNLFSDGSKDNGHCGEATALMELMLRMIGIKAHQAHVYGRSTRDLLQRNDNFTIDVDGMKEGAGPETRPCKVHQTTEQLGMNFNTTYKDKPQSNVGEGCVEVHGHLYSGLVNLHGIPSLSRSAAQDMLYKLEDTYGKLGNPERKSKFQIWLHLRPGNEIDVCDAREAGETLYGLDVPR